jgi:hypothetical protein
LKRAMYNSLTRDELLDALMKKDEKPKDGKAEKNKKAKPKKADDTEAKKVSISKPGPEKEKIPENHDQRWADFWKARG